MSNCSMSISKTESVLQSNFLPKIYTKFEVMRTRLLKQTVEIMFYPANPSVMN